MNQRHLFDEFDRHERTEKESVPFVRGSETSEEAADSVRPLVGQMKIQVYEFIASRGPDGATCDETEEALEMRHQTCSARFRDLRLENRIVQAGKKRLTRSGRKAEVYIATEI